RKWRHFCFTKNRVSDGKSKWNIALCSFCCGVCTPKWGVCTHGGCHAWELLPD
ncbi:hypothetical protein CSUI_007626, partial [Cystoisospora suis]